MASYPTSVWAPATKNTNDVIQAAHVNDAQAEIVAIETGLLNGTAPLNSSNSTVAALNVTGASTLAGTVNAGNSTLANLTVTGGSTFTGDVKINSTLLMTVPCVRVTNTAIQNVASAAFTGLNWDTEAYDAAGMHSTASNSSRLTFAASTGTYTVGATVEWSAGTTGGQRVARLMLNDATPIAGTLIPIQSLGGGAAISQSVVGVARAAALTDYVTVQVYQDSGSTQSISSGATYGCVFWSNFVSLR